ncbi:MAG: AAA family ATPase [Dehalococcoidia bacterium]
MIPITLKLENFMSYREEVPELDFTGMTVAALSGRNGHGKSALLDSITWALWGRCRVRSADDLVSLGADETRVELTFSASNQTYRVIRSHIKSGGRRKTGITDLQLQIQQTDQFIPITEDSVRNTQAKIISVISMDYETFINSAFLLQGHSDEFTNKTPSQRKEILANILGLEIYDKFQEEARALLGEFTSQLQSITGAMQYIEADMETLDLDEDTLIKNVESESVALNKKIEQKTKLEMEWNSKSEEVTRSEIEINRLKQMSETLSGIENDINFMNNDRDQKQVLYKTFESLFDQEEIIRHNNMLFEKSRNELDLQQKEQTTYMELQSKLSEIELLISRYQVSIETQLNQKESEIHRYSDLAKQLPDLFSQQEKLENELLATKTTEEDIKTLQNQDSLLTSQISEAQTLSEVHEKEGLEIKQKLDLIEHSSSDMHSCPLCQSQLDESSAENLKNTYHSEIESKRTQYVENKTLIDKLSTELGLIKENVRTKTSHLENYRQQLTTKITVTNKQIEDSSHAETEIIKLKKECETLAASLNKQDFLQEEQKNRKELTSKLEDSVYNAKTVETLQQYISDNQNHANLHTQLLTAKAQAPETVMQIGELTKRITQKQNELAELSQNITTIDSKIAASEQLKSHLNEIQQSLNQTNEQIRNQEINIQNIQSKINRAKDSKEKLRQFKSDRSDTENKHKIYTEVANAFGKQGIQAMLIEALIPQIEEETNQLLSKMTDNRLYTTLETTRERRTGKGDPIETLDISIADELGKRSYESYSGGEAFRINLALRIALSKVLARRSGASLPVLFLDEGFGTQDSVGREKILDTISAIGDQFEMIIVITHLDDLKDAFPTRIEVVKDQAGSTYTINSA